MFEIKNVSKQYNGQFALNNVSLNIGKNLNFIVGASGSGKTTLLKIISGMEKDFEGEISYCGKNIKSLSTNEKGYFYNNIFGFVWQDFNLIEDMTVIENIILPQYIKENLNKKISEKILKELEISDIANQKVKYLSGGQKQRVAIARELMKNPQVIFADEPTSALDEKTSKTTMDILRKISKSRIVIIVTHDTSMIAEKDNVYEIDKGEILSKPEINLVKNLEIKIKKINKLSYKNAFLISKCNIKNKFGRFLISTLSIMIASILLLTTLSGAINSNSQGEFDKLIDTYGDSLTDIGIYNSFTDAVGTDQKENNKPSGDITQDISELYDLYADDERISFISYLQAFDNIITNIDEKEYKIKNSGSMPSINKLISGRMPMGDENEVVVPESYAKQLKITPDEIIGKEIDFKGSIMDWSNGNPVSKNISSKAKIVGVMDTTQKDKYAGEIIEYTVDDSFLFSKSAMDSMLKQADQDINKMNFLIRAKTPSDMISIKDELHSKGIVPIGRFELVEDMVRLNNQTTQQSGSASIIIGILSIVMIISIFLITGFMRKKEYAIYKVSGFTSSNLFTLNLTETVYSTVISIIFMIITSPIINLATKGLFGVNILNIKMLFIGSLMIGIISVIAYLTSVITSANINLTTDLKSGDR